MFYLGFPSAIVSADQSSKTRVKLAATMPLRELSCENANDHSKGLRHHAVMQALFVAWYNSARKHEALNGKSLAMASRLTDHEWTIKELIEKAAQ